MRQEHWTDESGNPAGGCTYDVGFCISWQNGPLGRGTKRRSPNGAFVEEVIKAALGRLRYYQDSKFRCLRNADAIIHLEAAIESLNARTADRETREVEGTHQE